MSTGLQDLLGVNGETIQEALQAFLEQQGETVDPSILQNFLIDDMSNKSFSEEHMRFRHGIINQISPKLTDTAKLNMLYKMAFPLDDNSNQIGSDTFLKLMEEHGREGGLVQNETSTTCLVQRSVKANKLLL